MNRVVLLAYFRLPIQQNFLIVVVVAIPIEAAAMLQPFQQLSPILLCSVFLLENIKRERELQRIKLSFSVL